MRLPPDCLDCGNSGTRYDPDGAEHFCTCRWGEFLQQKDDQGSLYTLRAFILRLAEPTP